MGMSGYVMDKEDEFFTLVEQEIAQAEDVSQVHATAGAVADLYVPHLNEHEVQELIDECWQEYWSKYNM